MLQIQPIGGFSDLQHCSSLIFDKYDSVDCFAELRTVHPAMDTNMRINKIAMIIFI